MIGSEEQPHLILVGEESRESTMAVGNKSAQPRETLSEFVRRVRTEKGLSLAHVERESGRRGERIAASYINRIENGINSRPTADRLCALARGLGIPEEELFAVAAGRMPANANDADEVRLVTTFRELSPTHKEDLLRILEVFRGQQHGRGRRRA